jgi:hypothetical protein
MFHRPATPLETRPPAVAPVNSAPGQVGRGERQTADHAGSPLAIVARAAPSRRVRRAQPFAMVGLVRERFLLTYRVDPRAVQALAPGPFRPVVRDGAAFAGVCLVEMQAMRPAGVPALLGFSYQEAIYRVVVEYDSPTLGRLVGVVSPRADANQPAMVLGGRWWSHYPFHLARLHKQRWDDVIALRHRTLDGRGDLDALLAADPARAALPPDSCFPSLADAVEFLVGMEHSFSWDPRHGVVHRSRIAHAPWAMSVALPVRPPRLAYFEGEPFRRYGGAMLDSVLYMRDVPHVWHATEAEPPAGPVAHD